MPEKTETDEETKLNSYAASQRRLTFRVLIGYLLLAIVACSTQSIANAGISGENIIIVVNSESLASRTVANHYVQLRSVPANNVIFLKDIPDDLVIGLEDFKSKILKPILQTLEKRGLVGQTRCIAYSAGFPTSVDIRKHYDRLPNAQTKKLTGTLGSLTGLTYLYKFVLADSELYLSLGANLYARGKFDRTFRNPFNNASRALFDEANKKLTSEPPAEASEKTAEAGAQFAEAGKTFEDLFTTYPTLSPLAILAARSYAKAGDPDAATRMIQQAIKAGWWSAEYLRDEASLAPLLKDASIQRVLPALSNHVTIAQGPMSFSAVKSWTASGYPVAMNQGGMPYLMSCSLAMVHPVGNTLDQSVGILRRAAGADWTYPDGEFLFAGNSDVRAKTRMPGVGNALLYMQTAGFATDVFKSTMPSKSVDVAGLFLGTATANFKNTNWKLQPGAIAETLTSTAGDFRHRSQTKITEYLAAGAAMSSGTVMEPYSLQPKFPNAMMHGYYASGMSAIESFYLSVQAPYQLLIVGDPACQPFANPPAQQATIDLLQDEAETKVRFQRSDLSVALPADQRKPFRKHEKPTPLAAWEIFVEGRLIKSVPPIKNVDMNLTGDLSGVVDVRASLVGFDASEPKRTFRTDVEIEGELPIPVATLIRSGDASNPDEPLITQGDGSQAQPISIHLHCVGADSIRVTHLSETVGTVQGDSGTVEIDLSQLGGGPHEFRPVALFGKTQVFGRRIDR